MLQWVSSGLCDDEAGKQTQLYSIEVAVGGLFPVGVMPLALFEVYYVISLQTHLL